MIGTVARAKEKRRNVRVVKAAGRYPLLARIEGAENAFLSGRRSRAGGPEMPVSHFFGDSASDYVALLETSLGTPMPARRLGCGPDSSPYRYTQIDALPSFRHGVPESRARGWVSGSSTLCPGFRHSPGIPCRGRFWRYDEMCLGVRLKLNQAEASSRGLVAASGQAASRVPDAFSHRLLWQKYRIAG